jgi:nucleoid-associated protein YgaU
VLIGALVLGLVIGVGLALRGRPVLSTGEVDAAVRPTIVVVAAPSAVATTAPTAAAAGPGATPTAGTVNSVIGEEYVVEPGDTMRGIALKAYGDADGWQTIYSANQDRIGSNPDALQAGVTLRIPPRR